MGDDENTVQSVSMENGVVSLAMNDGTSITVDSSSGGSWETADYLNFKMRVTQLFKGLGAHEVSIDGCAWQLHDAVEFSLSCVHSEGRIFFRVYCKPFNKNRKVFVYEFDNRYDTIEEVMSAFTEFIKDLV